MILYIANRNYSSWSLRPWVLMRELGIEFEERLVPFCSDGPSHGLFRAFSPSGLVPCLVDGETVVWDSLAIIEYVAEGHPKAWPAERVARAWARCASAEMHSGFRALRDRCSMSCGVRVRLHAVDAALARDIGRLGELWEEGLARHGGPFLAGPRFTAVDAFFAPVAFRIQTYGLDPGAAARAYAQRLLDLGSMQQWIRGALAEPWRDEPHEAEIRGVGTVLEDRRIAPDRPGPAGGAPREE
jgi:glutathione S-transferase